MAALPVSLISACLMVAACSHAGAPTRTPPPAATSTTSTPGNDGSKPSARPGSLHNPLVLTCADAVLPYYTHNPYKQGPGDLAIGPFLILDANLAANLTPSQYGYRKYGRDGRAYKMPILLKSGSPSVTIAITGSQHNHAVIDIPEAHAHRIISATYQSCSNHAAIFAQGFAFMSPPYRGCVPLTVTINRHIYDIMLSLFAGTC